MRPDRVLLIDDDPLQVEILHACLSDAGIESIVCCDDGTGAMIALKSAEQPFDLIVTDLHMPQTDGVELINFMRDHEMATPIILVTGADGATVAAAVELCKAYRLNVLGALSKPVSLDKLTEILNTGIYYQRAAS